MKLHKENITPSIARASLLNLSGKNEGDEKLRHTSSKELILRGSNSELSATEHSTSPRLEAQKVEHYKQALRLVNERLANEIESHMETHLDLEGLRDQMSDFDERERKANKQIDTLLSEMEVLKARQHSRENEFVRNIIKHQDFLQEERQKRFKVEKELHKALRKLAGVSKDVAKDKEESDDWERKHQLVIERNQSLEETVERLELANREYEDELQNLSTELEESKRVSEEMEQGKAAPPEDTLYQQKYEEERKGKLEATERLVEVTDKLEEAIEATRMHKEEIETKDVHCNFLQDQLSITEASLTEKESQLEDLKRKVAKMEEIHASSLDFMQVNEDIINELEQKEDELSKKKKIIEELEEELMQKDGANNLLRETIEMYKNRRNSF